jgi:phosphoglycerate dehydrogenase-like enzyme
MRCVQAISGTPGSTCSTSSRCRPGHVLTTLPNVTLSAHSAFRTPEANVNLIEAAFVHCRRIVANQAIPR